MSRNKPNGKQTSARAPRELVEEAVAAYRKAIQDMHRRPLTDTAKRFKIGISTLHYWNKLLPGDPRQDHVDPWESRALGADEAHVSVADESEALAATKKPAEEPKLAGHDKRRFEDRITNLNAALKEAQRDLAQMEDLRRDLFRLTADPIDPQALEWIGESKKRGGDSREVPLLFISDEQVGEVIRADEMSGANAYDIATYRRRHQRLVSRSMDLLTNHSTATYEEFVFLFGGDSISGDIHAELRETNELTSAESVKVVVEERALAVRKALESGFKRVVVVSVPGNHGRPTDKPHAKRNASANYDTIVAWWLQDIFRDDKRVRFVTPASGDALFPVLGWNFCLTHGDAIGTGGGRGFIGATAPIARGMRLVAEYYSRLGVPLDYILIGHFHVALELEWGFSNGSIPGMSEYSKKFRMTPQPPVQWLLTVHRDLGVAQRWKMFLESKPSLRALGAQMLEVL